MNSVSAPSEASSVRAEDAFDVAALAAWLRAHLADDSPSTLPAVRQFRGGASNLTYLLEYPDRDLILRRPPGGRRAEGAHDMAREYRVQTALRPHFDYAPATVALCEDEDVIGTPFYLMERLDGLISRKELPPEVDLAPERVRALCVNALDVLVQLHSVDPQAAGLTWMSKGPATSAAKSLAGPTGTARPGRGTSARSRR
nr:phosphotransferase family protein [Streptacidiphilus jeojiense]